MERVEPTARIELAASQRSPGSPKGFPVRAISEQDFSSSVPHLATPEWRIRMSTCSRAANQPRRTPGARGAKAMTRISACSPRTPLESGFSFAQPTLAPLSPPPWRSPNAADVAEFWLSRSSTSFWPVGQFRVIEDEPMRPTLETGSPLASGVSLSALGGGRRHNWPSWLTSHPTPH